MHLARHLHPFVLSLSKDERMKMTVPLEALPNDSLPTPPLTHSCFDKLSTNGLTVSIEPKLSTNTCIHY